MSDELPRVSAHALAEYERCPRKFALRFKVGRHWPAPDPADAPKSAAALALGQAFHHLVQAHALGLNVTPVLAAHATDMPTLSGFWQTFVDSSHAAAVPDVSHYTEQTLHFTLAPLPFTVRYDRVERQGDRWTIVDWKTGKVTAKHHQDSWQTRLYLFALAEAGQVLNQGQPIDPAAIRLVYWEAASGKELVVPHDADRQKAWRADLTAIASQLAAPFDEEAPEADTAFPRRPAHCPECSFDALCNRQPYAKPREEEGSHSPRFVLEGQPRGEA